MKKLIITFFFSFSFFTQISFSQIDEIFKHIPGVEDIFFDEAVSTSIKDAYPTAWWLNGLDKQINLSPYTKYTQDLPSGYYKYNFKTFCLHAGAYTPGEGNGYLVAPLKGAKAKLISKIFTKYNDHPEIPQTDVQVLVWGIEAGAKYSSYQPDFQIRVAPLLDPEDIAQMEVDVKEIAMDLLPQDVKDILNVYSDIRQKIADPLATYEQIEQIAVRTGIPPLGKGSRNIDAGVWTSIGNNTFIRAFPFGFSKSEVEVYIPSKVDIKRDEKNRVISLDDGSSKIEITYDESPGSNSLNNQNPIYRFKTVSITDQGSNESRTIENEGWYIPSIKSQSGTYTRSNDPSLDEYNSRKEMTANFIKDVKRSLKGKKTKKLNSSDVKNLEELKQIELSLKSLLNINELSGNWYENNYRLAINAANSFLSKFISVDRKGGSLSTPPGGISNFVFAPANTSRQRLGTSGEGDPTGGPPTGNEGDPGNKKEKEKKECKVSVSINQVNEDELPKPDWVYTVTANIQIEGDDDNCKAEEISWELFDDTKIPGRYMNDKDKRDDNEYDLVMSDLNQDYSLTETTAKKQISGKSQTQQIHILCRDYGGYSKLKVTVTVGGKQYEAEADGTPDKFITIPYDLNDNTIADSWEKKLNVYGKQSTWDEDPNPSGQKTNGDGMNIFEEYRGFMVSDGSTGTEYVRMDPMLKELFVIDKDQIFDIASWKAASGIKAYWLNEDQVNGIGGQDESRRVDFCSGLSTGQKYAVRLIKVNGSTDPQTGSTTQVWGVNYASGDGPPKLSFVDEIFPDNINNYLHSAADTLKKYIKKYPTGYIVRGRLVTQAQMKKFVDIMNDATKSKYLVEFFTNATIVHEVGHACNIPHHGGGDTNKTTTGDLNCPMIYNGDFTYPEYLGYLTVVFDMIDKFGDNIMVSFIKLKFCKKKDNCWKHINVNDRL